MDKFIAVGNFGTVLSSSDGENWEIIETEFNNNVNDIIFVNDTFWAVGEKGLIIKSENGISWQEMNQSTDQDLNKVTYGNGLFIAVGNSGVIQSSSDGKTWANRVSGTNVNLSSIAFGNNAFVATGENASLLSSPDGENWQTVNVGEEIDFDLVDVAFGNSVFVAIGFNKTKYLTSNDGINWESRELSDGGYHIYYINDRFFIADWSHLISSNDGINWVDKSGIYLASNKMGLAYGSGKYVSVNSDNEIAKSDDGETWEHIIKWQSSIYSLAFGNDKFLALNDSGIVLSSIGGETWQKESELNYDSSFLSFLRFGKGSFFATDNQQTYKSTEGKEWEQILEGFNNIDYCLCNNQHIIVGDGINISENGINWQRIETPDHRYLTGITYGNGIYLATLEDGNILRSTDTIIWKEYNLGAEHFKPKATFGNQMFLIIEDDGTVFKSTDGIEWTTKETHLEYIFKLIHQNETFVALGYNNISIYSSTDGDTWQKHNIGTNRLISDIIFSDDKWTFVGDYGTIIRTLDHRIPLD